MFMFPAALLSYVSCRSTSCPRAKPVLACRMCPSRWWNAYDGVRNGRSNAQRVIMHKTTRARYRANDAASTPTVAEAVALSNVVVVNSLAFAVRAYGSKTMLSDVFYLLCGWR